MKSLRGKFAFSLTAAALAAGCFFTTPVPARADSGVAHVLAVTGRDTGKVAEKAAAGATHAARFAGKEVYRGGRAIVHLF